MTTLSPVARKEADELQVRQRRFEAWRAVSWGAIAVAAVAVAALKLANDADSEAATIALIAVAAAAALFALGLRVWLERQARALNARHMAELERAKSDIQAGKETVLPGPDKEPDWRWMTPEGRRKMKVRRWIFFGVGAVLLILAEVQYKERGNLPIAAVYAVLAVGCLVYWLVIGQRLRDMA